MRTFESGLDPRVGCGHRELLDKNVGVSRMTVNPNLLHIGVSGLLQKGGEIPLTGIESSSELFFLIHYYF